MIEGMPAYAVCVLKGELYLAGGEGYEVLYGPYSTTFASGIQRFQDGDILLTGTPSGVGRIVSGDQLLAEIERVGTLSVRVA